MIFILTYPNGWEISLEGHVNISESFKTKDDEDHYGVLEIHMEDPSKEADMFTGGGGNSSLYIKVCYLNKEKSIGNVFLKSNFPHCKTETEYDREDLNGILEVGGNRYRCNGSTLARVLYFFTAYAHCLIKETAKRKDISIF